MAAKSAGVVVSAGKMPKIVKVRMVKREYNSYLRKNYYLPKHFLVHDPTQSVYEGDIITIAQEPHSRRCSHVVDTIVAAFSKPLDERPPLLSAEQRAQIRDEKRKPKVERRAVRGIKSAIEEAKRRGWTAGTDDGIAGVFKEAKKEGANVERETVMQHGRTVLPGGLHRFGGKGEGGIEKEAWAGKQRAMHREQKAEEHEKEREKVESKSTQDVARAKLEGR